MKYFKIIILLLLSSKSVLPQDTVVNKRDFIKYGEMIRMLEFKDSATSIILNKIRDNILGIRDISTNLKDEKIIIEIPNRFLFEEANGTITIEGKKLIKNILESLNTESNKYRFEIIVSNNRDTVANSINIYNNCIIYASKIVKELIRDGGIKFEEISLIGELDNRNVTKIVVMPVFVESFNLLEPLYQFVDSVLFLTKPERAEKYLVKIDYWNSFLAKKNHKELKEVLELDNDFWVCNNNEPFRIIARKYLAIAIYQGQIFKKEFVILPNRKNIISIDLIK